MAARPQLRRASARLKQKAESVTREQGNNVRGDRSRVVQAQDENRSIRKRRKIQAETPSVPNSDSEDNKPVEPVVERPRSHSPVAPPHNLAPSGLARQPNIHPHPPPLHNHPVPYMMPPNYPYPYLAFYPFPQGLNLDGNQRHPPMTNGPVFPLPNAAAWNAHQFARAPYPANYMINAAAFYQPNGIPPEFRPAHQLAQRLPDAPRPADRNDPDQPERPRNADEESAYNQRHGVIIASYDQFKNKLSVILEARGRWRSLGNVVGLSEPLPCWLEYIYWPMFTKMAERDVDPDVIEAELEERTEDIRGIFQEWRAGLEEELANVKAIGMYSWWHEEQDTVDKVKKFREQPLPKVTPTTTMDDTPETEDDDTRARVLSNFSSDFRTLLTADAIFTTPESKTGLCFYPTDLGTLQNEWYYSGPWEIVGSRAEPVETFERVLPGRPKPDIPAIKVARRFLHELGCIGALHIEMSAQGDTFMCARCSDLAQPVGWKDMIGHYVKEHNSWTEMQENHPNATSHPSIKHKNVHDFSNYDEPTIHQLSAKEVTAHLKSMDDRTGVLLYCKLCIRLGIMFAKSGRVPLESHVRNVHLIEEPELLKHYGPCRDF